MMIPGSKFQVFLLDHHPIHILDITIALAGVTHWLEGQPVHQRVSGSIPDQGHIPGLQADLQPS